MGKKLLLTLFLGLTALSAGAQGILDRFTDPEKGRTVFIEKGHRGYGISGSYRSFRAAGEDPVSGDGFAVLSLLNIGDGIFQTWNATPSFSYFFADDLALDVKAGYSGYRLDTDLNLDLRNIFSSLSDESVLNVPISTRHMIHHGAHLSLGVRKYLSFFGSRYVGVFGEARLFGNYGNTYSAPIVDVTKTVTGVDEYGDPVTEEVPTGEKIPDASRSRISSNFNIGLNLCGGLCVKLRGGNAIQVSVPLVGVAYSYTRQHKEQHDRNAHLSQLNVGRKLDWLGLQIGYRHLIRSKK